MATSPNYGWLEPDNTDLVKNGALAIRTLGNAIDTTMATMTPKSTFTAKGSIAAATAASTPANLAVGADGTLLTADSSAAAGLSYQSNFAAGKNKIINGDFRVWQRGTSFTPPNSAEVYNADRFLTTRNGTGATVTVSQQTFTAGTAPVAGYEGQYYLRFAQSVAGTGGTFNGFNQRIEDVRTFAGQTVTISFWAKASAGLTLSYLVLNQNFGAGGSATVTNSATNPTFTTSWARYTATIAIPSISGKTIGTSSFLDFALGFPSNAVQTIDLWGIQVEAGSVATAFQTATGNPASELAACQRYYYRLAPAYTASRLGMLQCDSTTQTEAVIPFPVALRVVPTALEQSGTAADYSVRVAGVNTTCSAVPAFLGGNTFNGTINLYVTAGLIAGQAGSIRTTGTTGYLGWSAEL